MKNWFDIELFMMTLALSFVLILFILSVAYIVERKRPKEQRKMTLKQVLLILLIGTPLIGSAIYFVSEIDLIGAIILIGAPGAILSMIGKK